MNILKECLFSFKNDRRTRGYEVTLAKEQCRFTRREGDARSIGCTLDKPKSFLVHCHLEIILQVVNLVKTLDVLQLQQDSRPTTHTNHRVTGSTITSRETCTTVRRRLAVIAS